MTVRELETAVAGMTKSQLLNSEVGEKLSAAYGSYGRAMSAYDKHVREMEACTCEHDGSYDDGSWSSSRTPKAECPTHAEEDEDYFAELAEAGQ